MDRGAWQAAVHGSGKTWAWLNKFTHIYLCIYYIYVLILILFHYRLLKDFEYSSLCYTVGPCCLSLLYIVVCICSFQTPNLSPSPLSPLVTLGLFSMSVSLFLFCKQVHLYDLLDSTCNWSYIFVFLWLISLGVITSGSIHVAANVIINAYLSDCQILQLSNSDDSFSCM